MDEELPDKVFAESVKRASKEAVVWTDADPAVIGYARIWREGEWRDVLVYSYKRLCETIYEVGKHDMEYCEAEDFVEYNIAGSYVGPYTPLLVREWV